MNPKVNSAFICVENTNEFKKVMFFLQTTSLKSECLSKLWFNSCFKQKHENKPVVKSESTDFISKSVLLEWIKGKFQVILSFQLSMLFHNYGQCFWTNICYSYTNWLMRQSGQVGPLTDVFESRTKVEDCQYKIHTISILVYCCSLIFFQYFPINVFPCVPIVSIWWFFHHYFQFIDDIIS